MNGLDLLNAPAPIYRQLVWEAMNDIMEPENKPIVKFSREFKEWLYNTVVKPIKKGQS